VSGQIPADKEGNLVEGSIADKTKMCCENIIAILKEAGSDISRVVKVRACYFLSRAFVLISSHPNLYQLAMSRTDAIMSGQRLSR
jgi:enamine deaminase RidA (YjgF/YER057c/UK114 family)